MSNVFVCLVAVVVASALIGPMVFREPPQTATDDHRPGGAVAQPDLATDPTASGEPSPPLAWAEEARRTTAGAAPSASQAPALSAPTDARTPAAPVTAPAPSAALAAPVRIPTAIGVADRGEAAATYEVFDRNAVEVVDLDDRSVRHRSALALTVLLSALGVAAALALATGAYLTFTILRDSLG